MKYAIKEWADWFFEVSTDIALGIIGLCFAFAFLVGLLGMVLYFLGAVL